MKIDIDNFDSDEYQEEKEYKKYRKNWALAVKANKETGQNVMEAYNEINGENNDD